MARLALKRAERASADACEVEELKRSIKDTIETDLDVSRRLRYLLAKLSASSSVMPFCIRNVRVADIDAIPVLTGL